MRTGGIDTLLALARFQDPQYITRLFYQHGLLKEGEVLSAELKELPGSHSSYVAELKLQYSDEPLIIPEQLILKLSPVDNGVFEALFHQLIHRAGCVFPAPVLASGFDSEVSTCFSLMPDYRATHTVLLEAEGTFSTGLSDQTKARQAVACLAHFHNEMMENLPVDKDLGLGRYRDYALPLLESISQCSMLVDKFEEEGYSQKLAKHLRSLLPEAVHFWHSKVRPRLKEGSKITVIHGDCFWHHFWVPKTQNGSMMIFDFDLATVHSPIWDLVSLLSTTRPAGFETDQAIQCYRKHSGIDCSRNDIEEEFSWLSLCQIYHVLADWQHGCREAIWSQRLNNLLAEIPENLRQ